MPDIDMGEYTDTYKYLMEKERELAVYLEELKREYMRVLKRGNVYAVDVMHDKYKATVAIYKDHVSFMKELLAKQKAKQQIPFSFFFILPDSISTLILVPAKIFLIDS